MNCITCLAGESHALVGMIRSLELGAEANPAGPAIIMEEDIRTGQIDDLPCTVSFLLHHSQPVAHQHVVPVGPIQLLCKQIDPMLSLANLELLRQIGLEVSRILNGAGSIVFDEESGHMVRAGTHQMPAKRFAGPRDRAIELPHEDRELLESPCGPCLRHAFFYRLVL